MKEGKVIIKDLVTNESIVGHLKKDEHFWGGYKVEYNNSSLSINIVKDIQYMETQVIKGVGTLHVPIYKIHGLQRRRLKQQYSLLRSFTKGFSWKNQVNLDMGAGIEKDEEVEIIKKAQAELERIKVRLDELYDEGLSFICADDTHWYPVGMRKLLPDKCMFCGYERNL